MRKINNKKKLQKQAYELWKLAVIIRWGSICIVCPNDANQNHHFIPKSRNGLLRFDINNGVPLCQKHHYIVHFSNNPAEVYRIIEIIREKRGRSWCEYMDYNEKKLGHSFNNISWIKEQISKLKEVTQK